MASEWHETALQLTYYVQREMRGIEATMQRLGEAQERLKGAVALAGDRGGVHHDATVAELAQQVSAPAFSLFIIFHSCT